ncbi:MAG: hypothetical protein HYZ53_28310 [Planctomycetes bacterium]|nr:hypothetical protein [Planctomycetota bacterium]
MDDRWSLTDAERELLNRTIADVEKTTAGEIVVVLADRSDPYPEIGGKVGLIAALLAQVAVFSLPAATPYLALLVPLLTVVFFALGWWSSHVLPDSLERLLVGRDVLEQEVREKALATFHQRRLGATRDRTGCLIFASLFERVVVVYGDVGISAKVPDDRWGSICANLSRGIGEGRPVEALEAGIRACGAVLAEHFPPKPDDVNEIPDEVVLLG